MDERGNSVDFGLRCVEEVGQHFKQRVLDNMSRRRDHKSHRVQVLEAAKIALCDAPRT